MVTADHRRSFQSQCANLHRTSHCRRQQGRASCQQENIVGSLGKTRRHREVETRGTESQSSCWEWKLVVLIPTLSYLGHQSPQVSLVFLRFRAQCDMVGLIIPKVPSSQKMVTHTIRIGDLGWNCSIHGEISYVCGTSSVNPA